MRNTPSLVRGKGIDTCPTLENLEVGSLHVFLHVRVLLYIINTHNKRNVVDKIGTPISNNEEQMHSKEKLH